MIKRGGELVINMLENVKVARDEDNDGFCEVHVNTIEGVWSSKRNKSQF